MNTNKIIHELQMATLELKADNDLAEWREEHRAKLERAMKEQFDVFKNAPRVVHDWSNDTALVFCGSEQIL